MKKQNISNFNWYSKTQQKVVILEGGLGINDTERSLNKWLHKHGINTVILEELYENPSQILALEYLKPTILVIGTTGTYKEEMDEIYKNFKKTNHLPDHVFISVGIDGMRDFIRESLAIKPSIKFWHLFAWDEEDITLDEFSDYEIPK